MYARSDEIVKKSMTRGNLVIKQLCQEWTDCSSRKLYGLSKEAGSLQSKLTIFEDLELLNLTDSAQTPHMFMIRFCHL